MRILALAFGLLVALLAPLTPVSAQNPLVTEIQRSLAREGYNVGSADGVLGHQTRAAIKAFEQAWGLPVTGAPSPRPFMAFKGNRPGSPPTLATTAGSKPVAETKIADRKPVRKLRLLPPDTQRANDVLHAVPPESPFATRNWLIRDQAAAGGAIGPPFGVFLEEGGSVVGPRFASKLQWTADGQAFSMTYQNSIGQKIVRTARLITTSRMEGQAEGPGGKIWRWAAEAEPR